MWYRKQEIIKMDKQIERAGDDNKNNIGAETIIDTRRIYDIDL